MNKQLQIIIPQITYVKFFFFFFYRFLIFGLLPLFLFKQILNSLINFFKIAWAPGQAMKDKEWKDYWEIDDGVSYIPWEKLNKDIDYDELEVGGMLDEDTMPEWLKSK